MNEPEFVEANRRIGRGAIILSIVAFILPWILPNSSLLTENSLAQFLNHFIPSASKLAHFARWSKMIEFYLLIVLSLSFLTGLLNFYWDPTSRRLHKSFRTSSAGKLKKWLFSIYAIGVCALLIWLFYYFPMPSMNLEFDGHGSRGQLFLSLMLNSKLWLGVFGAVICVALSMIWLYLLVGFYFFFFLPFYKAR